MPVPARILRGEEKRDQWERRERARDVTVERDSLSARMETRFRSKRTRIRGWGDDNSRVLGGKTLAGPAAVDGRVYCLARRDDAHTVQGGCSVNRRPACLWFGPVEYGTASAGEPRSIWDGRLGSESRNRGAIFRVKGVWENGTVGFGRRWRRDCASPRPRKAIKVHLARLAGPPPSSSATRRPHPRRCGWVYVACHTHAFDGETVSAGAGCLARDASGVYVMLSDLRVIGLQEWKRQSQNASPNQGVERCFVARAYLHLQQTPRHVAARVHTDSEERLISRGRANPVPGQTHSAPILSMAVHRTSRTAGADGRRAGQMTRSCAMRA